jgi:hypothetical protein
VYPIVSLVLQADQEPSLLRALGLAAAVVASWAALFVGKILLGFALQVAAHAYTQHYEQSYGRSR